MSLPEALEAAAGALDDDADAIRPANGDPLRLLELLEPEASQRVLLWLLDHHPDDGIELAEEWETDPAGAELVAELPEKELGKAGRKVLRRLKHRLRSRGIEVAREAPAAKVAGLADVEEGLEGAWITPLDPSGARMAILVEDHPSMGSRLFEVILDDERGLVSFEVYSASRGKLRRFLKSLTERSGHPAVEVEERSLKAVIARALAVHPKDRGLPRGFGEWRTRLTQTDGDAKLPGELAREALPIDDDAGLLDRAVGLIEAGRAGPWPPSREILSELFQKIRAAMDSPLIVSGATKRERLDSVLAEGADEIYAGEGRATAAHRFRESAFTFWKRGDEDAARACLAAATAFEEREPRDNPLTRSMLWLPLAPAIAELEIEEPDGDADGSEAAAGEGSDDESLIVTP
ncbi:MAG: hypothetical protein JRH01_12420 [Deltaproteobacteria bacterium]|nr:hypothetical protein [Deltaproteobacteria bacterium]MBW2395322.1 hypothetical protein [Deltaproteobacteria bacterium]